MSRCDRSCAACQDRVRRTLEGDKAAFSELIADFDGLILHIVRDKLRGRRSRDWDDCAQEVRMRLWKGLGSWRDRGLFCGWVSAVAANAATDWVRGDGPATRPLPPDLPAREPGPPDPIIGEFGGGGGPIARRTPDALPTDLEREDAAGDRRRTRHRDQKILLFII
jgi:DNA-directed RNA polymerase specialized sigma24 family protein